MQRMGWVGATTGAAAIAVADREGAPRPKRVQLHLSPHSTSLGAGGTNQWIEPLAGVRAFTVVLVVAASILMVTPDARAEAQCPLPALTSGLLTPLGVAQSTQGNLLVAETGIHGAPNSGRISIVDVRGNRRTLVEGLPSGTNDVNEPSGPAGIIIRGRTAYVAIGIGDSGLPGPFPGTLVVNPTPSSALFSSVLAIHFSAAVEKRTSGFILTSAHNAALAAGEKVTLSNGAGDRATIEVVANFPDSTPAPLAGLPDNRRGVNPFDLVALGGDLFVTDGGQNAIWRVDLATGAFEVLTTFPQIVNPMFPFGPPTTDAVPTGIRVHGGQLLVTLLTGFPFAEHTSTVEEVDPETGAHALVLDQLTTGIDVLAAGHQRTEYWSSSTRLAPCSAGQDS